MSTDLHALSADRAALFWDTTDCGGRRVLHAPERERPTPNRSDLLFDGGTDDATLARQVLAQAVRDARETARRHEQLSRHARCWLSLDTPDLRFWCVRAGIDTQAFLAWTRKTVPYRPWPDRQ